MSRYNSGGGGTHNGQQTYKVVVVGGGGVGKSALTIQFIQVRQTISGIPMQIVVVFIAPFRFCPIAPISLHALEIRWRHSIHLPSLHILLSADRLTIISGSFGGGHVCRVVVVVVGEGSQTQFAHLSVFIHELLIGPKIHIRRERLETLYNHSPTIGDTAVDQGINKIIILPCRASS